jgi:hypothetical protein
MSLLSLSLLPVTDCEDYPQNYDEYKVNAGDQRHQLFQPGREGLIPADCMDIPMMNVDTVEDYTDRGR